MPYTVTLILRDLDYISLMSYDFEGAWNPYTGHNAPLKVRSDQVGNDVYLNVVSLHRLSPLHLLSFKYHRNGLLTTWSSKDVPRIS